LWKQPPAFATRFRNPSVRAGLFRVGHGTIDAIFSFMHSSWIVCTTCLAVFLGWDSRSCPANTGCSGGTILRSGDESSKKPRATKAAKVHSKDRDMGAALRTVYQKTVDEAIPPEMLDLLGKLD